MSKPTKPKPIRIDGAQIAGVWSPDYASIEAIHGRYRYMTNEHSIITAKEARRLAAWLLKFSEWCDYMEAKKRGKV